jgi:ABC-type Fe3+-siderophore transport system permease subunit
MRPLTFQGVLLRCGALTVVLFVVVVIALKLGAVPVSLYGLGLDLLRVLLRKTSELSSNYDLIVIDIRLPRILLAIIVGASLAVAHFRPCFAIPWRIRMFSAFPAGLLWEPSSR